MGRLLGNVHIGTDPTLRCARCPRRLRSAVDISSPLRAYPTRVQRVEVSAELKDLAEIALVVQGGRQRVRLGRPLARSNDAPGSEHATFLGGYT